ncbi:MAG TPA: DMT family transporter [Oxalicibacterium sp.]|nr:DMT family transporter [Oxalicibacterium sp.]
MQRIPLFSFFALLAGGTALGFGAIFMRLSDVGPIASAFWRMALAAPLLWCWAIASRRQDESAGRRITFTPALLWAGLCFGGDMAFWHLSLHYTTVSNATLLTNAAPVLIALWLWCVRRVRFGAVFIAGMWSATIGAVLLVAPDLLSHLGGARLLGDALGLISAVFYAAYQLVIKDARDQYSTPRLMAWSTTITGLALLPLALLSPQPFLPNTLAGWLPLLGLALLAQIGGQTVIAFASAHLPASLSSVTLLIQPLTATVAAWLLFGETIAPVQMLGGALLIAGIYFSRRGS